MIDLHCHSNHSDGTLPVSALLDVAQTRGVKVLSVTDHDTLAGTEEAKQQELDGLQLVSGVEISGQWQNKTLHILALDVDTNNAALRTLLQEHQRQRQERAAWFSNQLSTCFPGKNLDQVFRGVVGESLPCRSHVARALVEGGVASSVGQAFERWLARGKRLAVDSHWLPAEDVVRIIKESGGVAVLAHPTRYRLSNSRLTAAVQALAEAGLDALELSYPGVDSGKQRWLARLCRSLMLRGSAGSDFHGPEQTWNHLGKYPPYPESVEPVWLAWSMQERALDT